MHELLAAGHDVTTFDLSGDPKRLRLLLDEATLAAALESRALHGDGLLSLAGAALALATLASVALDQTLGWWWADAVAALLISTVLAAEGVRMSAEAHRGGG